MRKSVVSIWLISGLVFTSCGDQEESKRVVAAPTNIAVLDSVDHSGRMVSIGGFVSTPYNGRYFVLDDGTGRIPVILPESLSLGVERRILVEGLAGELEGFTAIYADVWLYDSTGTPVHSP